MWNVIVVLRSAGFLWGRNTAIVLLPVGEERKDMLAVLEGRAEGGAWHRGQPCTMLSGERGPRAHPGRPQQGGSSVRGSAAPRQHCLREQRGPLSVCELSPFSP